MTRERKRHDKGHAFDDTCPSKIQNQGKNSYQGPEDHMIEIPREYKVKGCFFQTKDDYSPNLLCGQTQYLMLSNLLELVSPSPRTSLVITRSSIVCCPSSC